MNRLLDYLVLPREITDFERGYLKRVNRLATRFLILNIPVFVIIAACNHTGPLLTGILGLMLVAGPVIAGHVFDNPRNVSRIFAVAGVGLGGLLVHIGQGPMQIEMHFYFFVLIALMSVFANPSAIVIAAGTTALHHLIVYLLFPSSVFNYAASVWVVLVHAAFVIVESAATCFVARSFFDNVVGLEQIVGRRTAEVKLILDNVGQGFLRVLTDGTMSGERSAILDQWLGAPSPGDKLWSYFGRVDADFSTWLQVGLEAIVDDAIPLEMVLAQMPTKLVLAGRGVTLSFEYRPIVVLGQLTSLLVIVSDVTAEVAREEAEAEGADVLAMFERILKDRESFVEFLHEADGLVASITGDATPLVDVRRHLHTLKGNSSLAGMRHFAVLCHELESRMDETGRGPEGSDAALLVTQWRSCTRKIQPLLGDGIQRIELTESECDALLAAVSNGKPRADIFQMIETLKLEPTLRRLERVAEDARVVAARLGKGDLEVTIDAGDLRLDRSKWSPLWSSVTHLVRNALDHGIEPHEERAACGKPAAGQLSLTTKVDGDELVIAFADDGCGIDWTEIRALAERRGLPHTTQADLEGALFADGVSTKDSVTEYSGRGVGMSAVAAATRDLSGRIRVHSERRLGTRVELRFPASLLRSKPRDGFRSVRGMSAVTAPAAAE